MNLRPTLTTLLSLVIALAAVGAAGAFASEWSDQELPLANSDKPLYQWNGWPPPLNMWIGGKCHKVRITDTRTPDEIRADIEAEYEEKMRAIDLREYNRGSWMVTVGLLIISASLAAHCMTSLKPIKRICEGAGLLGLGVVVAGFVQKKTVEWGPQIWWAMMLLIFLFVVYKMRHWSITHLFTGGTTKNKPRMDAEGIDDAIKENKPKI